MSTAGTRTTSSVAPARTLYLALCAHISYLQVHFKLYMRYSKAFTAAPEASPIVLGFAAADRKAQLQLPTSSRALVASPVSANWEPQLRCCGHAFTEHLKDSRGKED
ncbi:hypothetical protein TgHK011_005857 [Trichoderma gracile]|nr:hypothetical protein TgHK011_005857 [Trichoderma gracile]